MDNVNVKIDLPDGPMSEQEIFDVVVAHLAQQKRASQVNDHCKYRGPNGLMCGIGPLFHDSEYDPVIEGYQIDKVLKKASELALWREGRGATVCARLGHAVELLVKLQDAHDMARSLIGLRVELRTVASEHGLNAYSVRMVESWSYGPEGEP